MEVDRSYFLAWPQSVSHITLFFFILALIACFTLHLLGISAPMMTLLVYFITIVLNTAIAVRKPKTLQPCSSLLFSFASCCIWYGHFIWSIELPFWLRKHPKLFTDIFSREELMKVGIITFHGAHNYGSVLRHMHYNRYA